MPDGISENNLLHQKSKKNEILYLIPCVFCTKTERYRLASHFKPESEHLKWLLTMQSERKYFIRV